MVMLQSSPMKRTLRFEQLSCRRSVDGLPDVSVGHGGEAIGIITGWSLQWPGRPLLEGKREHLMALLGVVLPYARHLLSGVARPFGDAGPEAPDAQCRVVSHVYAGDPELAACGRSWWSATSSQRVSNPRPA